MSGPLWSFQPANGGAPFGHLGPAERTAYDPMAPADEVADAGRQVLKSYNQPGLIPPDLVQLMLNWVKLQKIERQVTKSLATSSVQSSDAKARTRPMLQQVGMGGRYIPKPGIPFHALRQLATRIEVAQAIHRTRRRQVLRFAISSQKDDEVGWRLRHIDPRHDETEQDNAYFSWLQQVLLCGGIEFDQLKRRRMGRAGFRDFLSSLVDDTLMFDHVAVETVPYSAPGGRAGLDSFYVRDSSTFFLSSTWGEADSDDIFAVQDAATNGMGAPGAVEFTYEELALFVRNRSTDLERCGYGTSELESSLETLTNFLSAMAFTREGLDNNAIPRGILVMSGQFPREQMEAFQAGWQARLRGAQNAWTLPVLQSRGQQATAQYINTNAEFSEMAFAKWISLQSSIMCAVYGLDPAEIGMESFTASSTSNLSGDDTAERLAAARDKGLDPLLSDIESFITENICSRFWDKARFTFTGVNPGDVEAKRQTKERLQSIDELRASLGMDPYPIKWIGQLPADKGLLDAEFQRQNTVGTLNEGRKLWGFELHPDPILGNTPLNPSFGASYQQALGGLGAKTGDDEDGGGDDGSFHADDLGADDGSAPDRPEGKAGEIADSLEDLHNVPSGGDQ